MAVDLVVDVLGRASSHSLRIIGVQRLAVLESLRGARFVVLKEGVQYK